LSPKLQTQSLIYDTQNLNPKPHTAAYNNAYAAVEGVTSVDLGVSSTLLSVYDYFGGATPTTEAAIVEAATDATSTTAAAGTVADDGVAAAEGGAMSAEDAAAAAAAAAADALLAAGGTGESGDAMPLPRSGTHQLATPDSAVGQSVPQG